jgi:fatty-acyl-CoA synthase
LVTQYIRKCYHVFCRIEIRSYQSKIILFSCKSYIHIISKVNINPAYVGRELEYCINKVGCKGILLSPSIKTIQSLSILRQLAPELDQQLSFQQLSLKQLPTLKHIILTGKQSSAIPGIHSYNDLLEHGAKITHDKLIERQASVQPDSPLAIFYTSGTTGQPKAATLTNFNMVNMSQGLQEHLGQYFTRLCTPIPMFHIFSEVVGVCNVVTAKCQTVFPAILPDPIATMRAIEEEKCTALIGAPIIFRDILNHRDRKKYDLTSLAYSALGASPMHMDFLRELEKKIPIKRVAQVYGMTENAAILTSSMWTGDENETRRLSSLGRCMQRLEIKVADREGNSVPIGQQGEIWARGFPVMIGYYGDIQKTNETITPSGWLRTGDEGTMDEDGYLYYIGRQKEMIIRGGVNIYPVEIENAILEHPSVGEVQVFSIPDIRYGEDVCAWIKQKPNAPTCQPEDIVKFLSDKLAFFKIPKHIRIVDKFIMTSTGKVQKFKMSESMVTELNKK